MERSRVNSGPSTGFYCGKLIENFHFSPKITVESYPEYFQQWTSIHELYRLYSHYHQRILVGGGIAVDSLLKERFLYWLKIIQDTRKLLLQLNGNDSLILSKKKIDPALEYFYEKVILFLVMVLLEAPLPSRSLPEVCQFIRANVENNVQRLLKFENFETKHFGQYYLAKYYVAFGDQPMLAFDIIEQQLKIFGVKYPRWSLLFLELAFSWKEESVGRSEKSTRQSRSGGIAVKLTEKWFLDQMDRYKNIPDFEVLNLRILNYFGRDLMQLPTNAGIFKGYLLCENALKSMNFLQLQIGCQLLESNEATLINQQTDFPLYYDAFLRCLPFYRCYYRWSLTRSSSNEPQLLDGTFKAFKESSQIVKSLQLMIVFQREACHYSCIRNTGTLASDIEVLERLYKLSHDHCSLPQESNQVISFFKYQLTENSDYLRLLPEQTKNILLLGHLLKERPFQYESISNIVDSIERDLADRPIDESQCAVDLYRINNLFFQALAHCVVCLSDDGTPSSSLKPLEAIPLTPIQTANSTAASLVSLQSPGHQSLSVSQPQEMLNFYQGKKKLVYILELLQQDEQVNWLYYPHTLVLLILLFQGAEQLQEKCQKLRGYIEMDKISPKLADILK